MKTKRDQRHTRANWQEKGVSAGYKATVSQDKSTQLVSSRTHVRPLTGKVFYLDLPSNRMTESLESDIKDLGGTVEKFFSKEIKYLVSNKREARYVQCLRQSSPVPSLDSALSSPHQTGSHGDNVRSRSRDQSDIFAASRGRSLVERVVKQQERFRMSKILSNAQEWGVKIIYIDDIIAYLQKKKRVPNSQYPPITAVKTNVKAEPVAKQRFQNSKGWISKPIIKVEDSSRHYCPIYLTMPNMPQFNLKTLPPCSPFFVEEKYPPTNKPRGNRSVKISASEERGHYRKKSRDKKGGGYCECCAIKYVNITTHIQSEHHKAFSKSDKYLVLDKLISAMHCNFIPIRNQIKRIPIRPKCSVSSVPVAPGPFAKTHLRHKGDLSTTNIIKEQRQTINRQKQSCSGQTIKFGSVSTSATRTNRGEEDLGSDKTHSDRTKQKSLGLKRLCKWNSCTEKASQPRMGTSHPRGEFGSSPCRLTQIDSVDQIITEHMTSSMSIRNNEVGSVMLNSTTDQQEQTHLEQKSSTFEYVQDGNMLCKIADNNLSEKEGVSFSPVRKIQRRVRIYKRKRRKVDAHVEHVKPTDIPVNFKVELLELFQSSGNMDEGFVGFDVLEGKP